MLRASQGWMNRRMTLFGQSHSLVRHGPFGRGEEARQRAVQSSTEPRQTLPGSSIRGCEL